MAGEILKKAREESGADINEVSDALKIRPEYLSAIENDSFDQLPVAVYTIGYIRCYAKYLGVEAEPVIIDFVSHLASPKPSTIIPVSSSKRKVPLYLYVILAILIGLPAVAVYNYTVKSSTNGMTAEKINPPGTGEKPLRADPVPATAAPGGTARESISPAGTQAVAGGQVVPVDKKEHQLGITANDTAWIQIRFENGKVEEMTLRSGDSKDWRFADQVTLRIGNAGGVALKFDGKDLGVPGDPAQVLDLTFPQN